MKSTDEVIEQVLAGLKNVDPTSGMERRILEAAERSSTSPTWHVWAPWGLAGGIALASLLAAHLILPSRRPLQPLASPAASPSVATLQNAPAPPSSAVVERSHPSSGSRLQSIHRVTTRAKSAPQTLDARNVSFPAPPMPLTTQEKLLLRIAHEGDPVELAMLIPEVRARQQADAKAQFKEFFDPPAASAATPDPR